MNRPPRWWIPLGISAASMLISTIALALVIVLLMQ